MSRDEYLSPSNFPLTTQPGLDLRRQMLIDAANRDDLEALERRGTLSERQREALAELRRKAANPPV